jgi:hypothetical protein
MHVFVCVPICSRVDSIPPQGRGTSGRNKSEPVKGAVAGGEGWAGCRVPIELELAGIERLIWLQACLAIGQARRVAAHRRLQPVYDSVQHVRAGCRGPPRLLRVNGSSRGKEERCGVLINGMVGSLASYYIGKPTEPYHSWLVMEPPSHTTEPSEPLPR